MAMIYEVIDDSQMDFKCINMEYHLIVIPKQGVQLYGAFSFQVLFGNVRANGYLCPTKKYNSKNFIPVSLPQAHAPLSFEHEEDVTTPCATDETRYSLTDVISSRLRELVTKPLMIAEKIANSKKPCALLLIKLVADSSSRFVNQQYAGIFHPYGRTEQKMIGQTCFMMMKKTEDTAFPLPPKFMYSTDEYLTICSIIGKISLVGGPVLILGNKGVGKSTLMRYLVNNLMSKMKTKKIFLLDTDVGQSEMNPSGCISLSEIKKPLLGSTFAAQERSMKRSFFFGSNSPSTDMELYFSQVSRLIELYKMEEINSRERPILFVNTVGWVEGIGHDLMCSLIKCVNPLMLINVSLDGVLPFMVPKDLQQKTVTLKRQRTMNNFGGHLNPAMLRQFLMAGYMAQCFSLYPSPFCVELRLANVLSFRVRFGSVSVYFHPELAHVSDSLILCPLNCAVVALCEVEEGYEEAFVTTGVLDCPSLPTRLTLQKDEASAANAMLRCYGFGMIRAIDVERKIFHVITPVEPELLTRIKVFALGHELQTPPIMFDLKGFEPAPYLVELGKKVSVDQQKLYSPLRNITGMRRALESNRNRIYSGVSIPDLKKAANRSDFDLIFHIGDIAYDMHTDGKSGNRGDLFMREIEEVFARFG
uniref:Polyribonucleotide 5'-hydroxyl-kinase Clp1 P-loop domain-containing protein n=1 Tax=Ditylenchus dipsaci TaxID=166011 RepID=A0A915EIJ6_9BILA